MSVGQPGVLLVNLGTPGAPRAPEVRRYLREFLSDPRVIDVHPVARWLILNLFVLPFRPARSAAAYRSVWTPEGSPLLVHGRALERALAGELAGIPVELGMRYGEPSIAGALRALRGRGCDEVVVAPLYPQYASSSTGSSLERCYREAAALWNTPFVSVLPPFYDDPGFVAAFADVGRGVLEEQRPDHVLFSYHGLPERHVKKSDETGRHCLADPGCCDAIVAANRSCYRAQCFATTRALVAELGLEPERTSVAFQSRLGRTPWIRPYTDVEVEELARNGVRRLCVFCPSFVADCLETLEEIGLRADASFRAAGGESLRLVPSLNAHPSWVTALARMLRARMAGPGPAAAPGTVGAELPTAAGR